MRHRMLHLTATSEIGGTERLLLYVLEHVDRSRFEIEVGSLTGNGLLTQQVQSQGFSAWNLGMRHPLDPGGACRLFSRLRAGRFDLVQLYGLRADTLGRPLARLAGVPIIISTIHSPDPWRRKRHVWLDRLTAPLASFWISNSEAGRISRIQREHFAPKRIVTIHNGIPIPTAGEMAPPTDAERAAFEKEMGLEPGEGPRVAFIANLRRMKGHCDLIRALPRLLEEFPCLRIFCAGHDASEGEIPRLAREAGVDHAMRLLGFQADTTRLLRQCDMMILPSMWEGCPNSVQEAMALGRPIVTTRVGGIPEILESGKEGLLIEPQSPDALAEAMARLLRDPGLARALGSAARERALREFPIARMVGRIEAVYLWLLGQGPRPAEVMAQ